MLLSLQRTRADPSATAQTVPDYLQVVPFQPKMRVLPLPVFPTAHALLAEISATASRALCPPGVGLATRVQVAPVQCRIRVLPLLVWPTAHASLAEAAATPKSMLPPW